MISTLFLRNPLGVKTPGIQLSWVLFMKGCVMGSFSMRRNRVKKLFLIIFMGVLSFKEARADLQGDMTRFFRSMGFESNGSGEGAYRDQMGGYMTGGNLFARAPAQNMTPLSIQFPEIRSGCGGIDLFLGGFSFIDSQKMIEMLRKIASNAASYAFSLALKTVTPQISALIEELSAKIQDINNMNINSCQAAATLVGGMWPKTDESSKMLCQAMGSNYGKFSDWAESRQACGAEGRRGEINAQKGDKFKDVLGDEFNLAWKAIKKNPFLAADNELAEFFMSISGSIISKKEGTGGDLKYRIFHLPSLVRDKKLLDTLLKGEGDGAFLYRCDSHDEGACLNPIKKPIVLHAQTSLYGEVYTLMKELAGKIRNDDPISPKEKGFVNMTTLPLMQMLAVSLAFRGAASETLMSQFAEAISYDLLLQYLGQVIEMIEASLRDLGSVQIDGATIDTFRRDINLVRRVIEEERGGVYTKMMHAFMVIEKAEQIEKKLYAMFTALETR